MSEMKLARKVQDPFSALLDPFGNDWFYPLRRFGVVPVGYDRAGEGGVFDRVSMMLKCDVAEDEKGYEVRADFPGVAKEDISLTFDEGALSIEYKHDEKKDEPGNDGKWKVRERSRVSCSRTIPMPDADPETVKASMSDGVLTVTADKAERVETKQSITIE